MFVMLTMQHSIHSFSIDLNIFSILKINRNIILFNCVYVFYNSTADDAVAAAVVSLTYYGFYCEAFKTVFFEHFDKKTAIQCISIDRSLSRKMVKCFMHAFQKTGKNLKKKHYSGKQ